MTKNMVVKIALLRRMPRGMDFLDYILGDGAKLEIGQVIEIPFRNRAVLGLVVGFAEKSDVPIEKLKIIESTPRCLLSLPKTQVAFAQRIADFYHYPLPGILKMIVPDIPKRKATLNVDRFTVKAGAQPISASTNIKKIVEQIFCSRDKKYLLFEYDTNLKNQFFVETARRIISDNKQCLLLFPNLAKMECFLRFLPQKLAENAVVVTSQALLGKNQHKAIWQGIFDGTFKLIIGTRSALFFAFNNLGAVLVDSSHSVDYKNYDQNPRFHGITVAKWLSESNGSFFGLSSPAPRVVDYFEAKETGWKQIALGAIDWRPKIVNFEDVYNAGASKYFGMEMIDGIQQTLDRKQRALLIVNRKGEANALVCADCGFSADCDICKLPMNVVAGQLKCFRCGKVKQTVAICPVCHGVNLKQRGIGIERVAKDCQRLFPNSTIQTIQSGVDEKLDADIVIATADILNYLQWPQFALLGVIYVDSAIYSADYLANSRLYEFLHELVVRAKMSGLTPQVIVQTRFIENQAIQSFGLPYSKFFDQEILFRRQFKYPPFIELIKLICQGSDERATQSDAEQVHEKLKLEINKLKSAGGGKLLDVFPPYSYYAKQVRKRFRWQILVKIGKNENAESRVLKFVPNDCIIDKDPVSLL
jgi:primosomal protein N' (replication factor Y)